MIQLMQFEMKKIFKSTYFRVMIVAFYFFFLTFYIFVYLNTVKIETIIVGMSNGINSTEQTINELKSKNQDDVETKQMIEILQNSLELEKIRLKAYQERDWKTLLELEVEQFEPSVERRKKDPWRYSELTYPTFFQQESILAKFKWMLKKEVVPVLQVSPGAWITIYDVEFDSPEVEEAVLKVSNKYSSSGIYYLYHFFGLIFGFFGAVFFLFLFGDIVTKEGYGKNGAIHLLHTQPIHRDKILAGKFLTVMWISFLILFSTVILSLLFGTVFDRFGDWEYPVLIYGEDRTFTFINLGIFLLKSFALFFMILIFFYSILFLFSVLVRRVLIAIGLTLVTLFMGMSLREELFMAKIASYNPFHYFLVSKVITNELAVTLDNYGISFTNGMVSLSVASFIILAMTYGLSVLQNKYRS